MADIEALAKRLDELSRAVTEQRWGEFSMQIPADPKRDADIVLMDAATELVRMHTLLNTPHTAEFLEAVKLEAMHQRERWAAEHDAGKTDADWFWLVGYLAGKALFSSKEATREGNSEALEDAYREKAVHHIITTAAALLNWHAARTGADTRMRPGIVPPGSLGNAK
jgi:hypothetical protein